MSIDGRQKVLLWRYLLGVKSGVQVCLLTVTFSLNLMANTLKVHSL